jgi:hypothetical protein
MCNCYQWTNWAWRYLVSESSFSCQSETFCTVKFFSLFSVCQVITLYHTKKMLDNIWVNEGVKFCKIQSLNDDNVADQSLQSFENVAPDLHPKRKLCQKTSLQTRMCFAIVCT